MKPRAGAGCRGRGLGRRGGLGRGGPWFVFVKVKLIAADGLEILSFLSQFFPRWQFYLGLEDLAFHVGSEVVESRLFICGVAGKEEEKEVFS